MIITEHSFAVSDTMFLLVGLVFCFYLADSRRHGENSYFLKVRMMRKLLLECDSLAEPSTYEWGVNHSAAKATIAFRVPSADLQTVLRGWLLQPRS